MGKQYITGYKGISFADKEVRQKVKTVEENQIELVEDELSMEGISDITYDTLQTTNKTLIGGVNEVNSQLKDIANEIGKNEDGTDIELPTTDKTIKGAITELFQSASNGKTLIANAITGKGVNTLATDTFQIMATNINNIKTKEEKIECTGLILNKASLTFSDLITKQALSVTVAPPNTTYPIFWYSTNENICTVLNGVVTPVSNGNCSIIVCCGDKMAKCDVIVEEQIKLNKVNSSLRITEKDDGTIEYSTDVIIATLPSTLSGQTVTWNANNSNITLTPNGNKCTITASVLGNSIITVTCGNKKATCNVSVLKGISGEVISQYTNVTDGLVLNLEVQNGRIVDTVSNTEFLDDRFTIEDGYIKVISEDRPGSGAILNTSIIDIDNNNDATINSPLTIECCELQRDVDPLYIMMGFRCYPTGNIYTPFTKNFFRSYLGLDGKDTSSTWNKIASFDKHFSSFFYNINDDMYFSFSYDPDTVYPNSENESYIYKRTLLINGRINTWYFTRSNVNINVYKNNKYKFIRIYNRYLTDEERLQNYALNPGNVTDSGLYINPVKGGISGIGASCLYNKKEPFVIPHKVESEISTGTYSVSDCNNSYEYEIKDYMYSNPPSDSGVDNSIYNEVEIINVPNKLYVGQKYVLSAVPYPWKVSQKYSIKFNTNDSNICECYQGILVAKQTGNVQITATLSGTNITKTITIPIEEYTRVDNIYNVPSDYSKNDRKLKGGTTDDTMYCIYSAINDGVANGYNYIKFPKDTYNVTPVFDYADANESTKCFYVPNETTIDFSDSIIYIHETEYCTTKCYNMFVFDKYISHSKIINVNVFGERYNNTTHAEKDYNDQCNFIVWCRCEYCNLENCNFDSMVGFSFTFITNAFTDLWTGSQRRGRVYKNDYVVGKLDESGNKIDATDWICTPEYLELGYTKEQMKRFKFCTGQYRYYIIGSRWIYIYFYDENKQLLETKRVHQFEDYELPDNVKYFKISVPNQTVIPNNGGDDSCTIRFMPMGEPKYCEIKNCNFVNPGAWGVTFTGGVSCVLDNCYIENSARYGGAIDFEDGVLNCRHNLLYKCCINGKILSGWASHNLSSIGSYINTVSFNADSENPVFIGNTIPSATVGEKSYGVFAYNYYKKLTFPTESIGFRHDFENVQYS